MEKQDFMIQQQAICPMCFKSNLPQQNRPQAGSVAFRAGSVPPFLCLDDLEAGEILPFLLFQRIGDVFDGGGQAGQDDIFQRVGPFLGFVDRRGQTIDAVFHLGQLRREFFT